MFIALKWQHKSLEISIKLFELKQEFKEMNFLQAVYRINFIPKERASFSNGFNGKFYYFKLLKEDEL